MRASRDSTGVDIDCPVEYSPALDFLPAEYSITLEV